MPKQPASSPAPWRQEGKNIDLLSISLYTSLATNRTHTHTHTHTRCTLPLHSRDCVCLLDATALKLPFSLYTTTALLLLSRLSLSLSLPDLPARTSHRAVASNSPCSQTRLAGRKRTCECERCGTEQPPRSATDSTPSTAPPFATRLIGFRVA